MLVEARQAARGSVDELRLEVVMSCCGEGGGEMVMYSVANKALPESGPCTLVAMAVCSHVTSPQTLSALHAQEPQHLPCGAMTKRSHASISASHAEPQGRQTSYDGEGSASHEDGDGSSLKKARSFMATLVSWAMASLSSTTDQGRPATCVDRERQDATRTGQGVATVGP